MIGCFELLNYNRAKLDTWSYLYRFELSLKVMWKKWHGSSVVFINRYENVLMDWCIALKRQRFTIAAEVGSADEGQVVLHLCRNTHVPVSTQLDARPHRSTTYAISHSLFIQYSLVAADINITIALNLFFVAAFFVFCLFSQVIDK